MAGLDRIGRKRKAKTMRLWKYIEGFIGEKYLVVRRDGSIPSWPYFVLGARDPAAVAALQAYAATAQELKYDPQYVADIQRLAEEFEAHRKTSAFGDGDPDAPPHREDQPAVIEAMISGAFSRHTIQVYRSAM